MNSISQLVALLLVVSWPTEQPVPARTAPAQSAQATAALEDVSWSLTWLGEQRLMISARRPAPTLMLSGADHKVSGNSGCNEFSGDYQLAPDSLRFGPVVTTGRACADPVLNQREKQLLRVMHETRAWRINGNTLVLTGPGGRLARFERKPQTPN